MPATAAESTKERLLAAAEALFAARGIPQTTLRAVTAAAGANLAAVHYHFGSKDGLVEAVFARRLAPLNAERLARLDALERAAGGAEPTLRAVLGAFLEPAFRFGRREGREFFKLVSRAHLSPDPELRRVFVAQFAEVAARFGEALSRALPGAPRDEILWRVFFVVGAMCHTALNAELLSELTGGAIDVHDADAAYERLLDFAVAGVSTAAGRGDRR